MNPEIRTILANLELGRRYSDWEIVDRAVSRLAAYVMSSEENSNVRR